MTDWQPDRLTDWQADRPTDRTHIHACIALPFLTLPFLTLPYLALRYYTTIQYTTVHYVTVHYVALHCIALHCITLHSIDTCMHAYMAVPAYLFSCILIDVTVSTHMLHIYIYINTLRIIWYAYTFCNESLKRSSQISTQMVLHGIELFSFSFFALNSHMVLFYLLLFRSVLFDLCSILFCLISF